MVRADETRALVQSAADRQRQQREVASAGQLPERKGDEGVEKPDSDEYVPMTLTVLRHMLLTNYGWSADAIGTKGDNAHLKGYHRSRNWIKGSQYCTNRSYSVSETDGDAHGGDGNEIAAMDIVTDPASDALIYARLARG